jgi:hypothetical protein
MSSEWARLQEALHEGWVKPSYDVKKVLLRAID